jgi:hypothetical protein
MIVKPYGKIINLGAEVLEERAHPSLWRSCAEILSSWLAGSMPKRIGPGTSPYYE